MKPPLYVRPLSDAERDALKAGVRSSDAFTLRRSQILLASARGERPPAIAQQLACASQTVRNTIRAFNERGLLALQERSHRNHTIHTTFDATGLEQLQALAHRSPRDFGHPTSLWTLELLATESAHQGLTVRRVSDETIRVAIKRLGTSWKRAKHWITSPDPGYPLAGDARKKGDATG
jgi:transposase